MAAPSPKASHLRLADARDEAAEALHQANDSLKSHGGDGTSGSMDTKDTHGRIARLEGAFAAQQWAVGVVSAALLAAAAISVAVTMELSGAVLDLGDKVDALPSQLREELRGLNSLTLEALRSGREAAQPPAVVVTPQDAQSASPATPAAPAPTN